MTRWPAEAIWEAAVPLVPGFTVEVLPTVDSTNTELMRRVRGGVAEPVLLVAEEQTAGRGRLGRSWESSAGASLTFSLGLPLSPADWAGLSLAVGVILAESLHPRVQLKWPNDLWVAGRKLGGILVETASFAQQAAAQAPRYAVIGIGLNIAPRPVKGLSVAPAQGLSMAPAQGLSVAPAALQELDPALDAPAALLRVAVPLVQAVKAFEDFGFRPFQARFNARDALRDRAVALSDGTAGTAHGVGETGALLVHTAAGMQAVTSSEVSVRPAP